MMLLFQPRAVDDAAVLVVDIMVAAGGIYLHV
jgi:hypothetical protein